MGHARIQFVNCVGENFFDIEAEDWNRLESAGKVFVRERKTVIRILTGRAARAQIFIINNIFFVPMANQTSKSPIHTAPYELRNIVDNIIYAMPARSSLAYEIHNLWKCDCVRYAQQPVCPEFDFGFRKHTHTQNIINFLSVCEHSREPFLADQIDHNGNKV